MKKVQLPFGMSNFIISNTLDISKTVVSPVCILYVKDQLYRGYFELRYLEYPGNAKVIVKSCIKVYHQYVEVVKSHSGKHQAYL